MGRRSQHTRRISLGGYYDANHVHTHVVGTYPYVHLFLERVTRPWGDRPGHHEVQYSPDAARQVGMALIAAADAAEREAAGNAEPEAVG